MTRVLKDNKVIIGIAKNKFEATVEYMVQRMELILASPEDVIIKEGDTIDSKYKFLSLLCY